VALDSGVVDFFTAFNAPQWVVKIFVVVTIPSPPGGDFLVRV